MPCPAAVGGPPGTVAGRGYRGRVRWFGWLRLRCRCVGGTGMGAVIFNWTVSGAVTVKLITAP